MILVSQEELQKAELKYIDGKTYMVFEELQNAKPVSECLPEDLEPNTEQFAKWVASEIFDDNWEYNKDAFAEIACRKLAKLGIVKVKGNEWDLIKPKGGKEQKNESNRNYH